MFTYAKAEVRNGEINILEERQVDQSKLTSDCWSIQLGGLEACKSCEFLGKRDCGGKSIRKRLLKRGTL